MTTIVTITEDEFDNTYELLPNHLNPVASWSIDGIGYLFETYGEELEFVRSQDPRTIWTLLDGDDNDQYLVSGYHVVNRIGYLISKTPVEDGQIIECRIEFDTDGEV